MKAKTNPTGQSFSQSRGEHYACSMASVPSRAIRCPEFLLSPKPSASTAVACGEEEHSDGHMENRTARRLICHTRRAGHHPLPHAEDRDAPGLSCFPSVPEPSSRAADRTALAGGGDGGRAQP